ncbi:D-glycero-beta-D-manno-heptose-7-phosphate kinase [bacterium]|nr:D-glycero-beta-D-manno-heptose-7-phosphate kinase [bacterium]
MIAFTRSRLDALFKAFESKKIAVIGDLMLDKYIWGRVSRISPEAPVPVVDVVSETMRFGGAANVALNVQTLGARVIPIGVVGEDEAGRTLMQLFRDRGFPVDGVIGNAQRPTTVKTRIIAESQHVVRIDWEVKEGIPARIQKSLVRFVEDILADVDAVILEDYNKGLLVPGLIREIIDIANRSGRMTLVDPKFDHFFAFRNVTLFKPNRKEAADRLGYSLDSPEALARAGAQLLEKLDAGAVMITLGEDGMILFPRGEEPVHVPTRAMRVHDVSGAGDTVIATMAVAMTAGASLKEAATLANHAAGIVCGEVGIVPIDQARLQESMIADMSH